MATCSNENCDFDLEIDITQLDIEESETSGNHTTQYSGSGTMMCPECNTENEIDATWDVLNDTDEILSID